MDTSETYIKQCEKAEEIQALKTRMEITRENLKLDESWILYQGNDVYWIDSFKIEDNGECYRRIFKSIWLPRQDQLQEIIRPLIEKNFGKAINYLHREFTEWARAEQPEFETFEQLWLAFVMKEKYNKVWSGEDWIK